MEQYCEILDVHFSELLEALDPVDVFLHTNADFQSAEPRYNILREAGMPNSS